MLYETFYFYQEFNKLKANFTGLSAKFFNQFVSLDRARTTCTVYGSKIARITYYFRKTKDSTYFSIS